MLRNLILNLSVKVVARCSAPNMLRLNKNKHQNTILDGFERKKMIKYDTATPVEHMKYVLEFLTNNNDDEETSKGNEMYWYSRKVEKLHEKVTLRCMSWPFFTPFDGALIQQHHMSAHSEYKMMALGTMHCVTGYQIGHSENPAL